MKRHPLELPDELIWSPWKRLGFVLGAWFLLFLPGVLVALLIALLLIVSRVSGLHL